MTRLEKCKLAVEKGYTYDPLSGNVYNKNGKHITGKATYGYYVISLWVNNKGLHLLSHQFAWYLHTGNIVEEVDHIKKVTTTYCNNKLSNLRASTKQLNMFNVSEAKGYSKVKNKYKSQITLNSKNITLGYYYTEKEAHQAYLDAKKIYHIIT